jgi:hypothetical protein
MSQYVTLAQAQAIAAQLADIGGGVLPYNPATEIELNPPGQDTDPNKSGIYIPAYVCGPYPTPCGPGDAKFYHFRFQNGAEGFNAGLIAGTMAFSPSRWPVMLSLEVNAEGAAAAAFAKENV